VGEISSLVEGYDVRKVMGRSLNHLDLQFKSD